MQKHRALFPILIILLTLFAAGCRQAPDSGNPTPTQEDTVSADPTATTVPTPAPEPTALAPLVILLAPPGGDADLQAALEAQISAEAGARGLRWQLRQSMTGDEIAAEADFLVALAPLPDLNSLIAAAPKTHFLAIGFTGIEPARNLILVEPAKGSEEIEAFMGGYIGALLVPDARIGIITVQGDFETLRFSAFENGMRFFCGLCRPQFAPFYSYPFLLSLPADASEVEWRALADFMRDRLVQMVYVSPDAGGQDLINTLEDLGIDVVGGIQPPEGQANWIASLRSDPSAAYAEYIPRLLDGETDIIVVLPIELVDVDSEMLPDGKRRLVSGTLADLLDGYIYPGDVVVP